MKKPVKKPARAATASGAKATKKPAAKAKAAPAKADKAKPVATRGSARAAAPAKAAAPEKPRKIVRVPFPKKNQPPSEAEFVARLTLATGKKFEGVRAFLNKQAGVSEELYFYGPKTGWAYRYLRGAHSVATIMLHDERLVGILALDASALEATDFSALSDVAQRARRMAHGSPSLVWLDLPLDGTGATDFKALLKAKLRGLPPPPPPPPAARPA